MRKQTFLQGALILTVAGIVVKIIGSANRIILSRFLGGEGIGLYQMAYPVYQLALSVSSAGIPVAISILVAEKLALSDGAGARRVFQISLKVMALMGLLFSLLLYFGAGWLVEAQIVRDARAYYALAALAPAIFFVTVLSSFRGYFQGMQRMTPTAVSQIVEQFVRVVVMLALAFWLLPRGIEYAAAGASFGAGPGAAAGVAVLVWYYLRHRRERLPQGAPAKEEGAGKVMRRIVRLALPVSLANIMLPVTANIDLFIVPARLEAAGYSVAEATELFGYLTGMAVTLVNLPTILTASLAASLVPAISEAAALKTPETIRRRARAAFRYANLLMVPSFAGLYLLATPISEMLYATPNAGPCIAILAWGVVLLGIGQIGTGILQGLGHTTIPLYNMAAAALAKVFFSWALTAQPAWGIAGAAWATNADFGVAALLNLYFVHRHIGVGLHIAELGKVAFCTGGMSAAVLFSYDLAMRFFWGNTIATLAAIACGAAVYGALLLGTGSLTRQDLLSIPKVGARLSAYAARRGWVK